LTDALHRLSAAQTNQRQAAKQKARQLAEAARAAKDDHDADDTDKAKAAKKAADAAAASEALQCSSFWRGISRLDYDLYVDRGGIELSFMSMSINRSVALKEAFAAYKVEHEKEEKQRAELEAELLEEGAPPMADADEAKEAQAKTDPPALLFHIVPGETTMPADISFVSLFPKQAEWVYPPGVILEKKTEWKEFVEDADDPEIKLEATTVELAPRLRLGGRKRL